MNFCWSLRLEWNIMSSSINSQRYILNNECDSEKRGRGCYVKLILCGISMRLSIPFPVFHLGFKVDWVVWCKGSHHKPQLFDSSAWFFTSYYLLSTKEHSNFPISAPPKQNFPVRSVSENLDFLKNASKAQLTSIFHALLICMRLLPSSQYQSFVIL